MNVTYKEDLAEVLEEEHKQLIEIVTQSIHNYHHWNRLGIIISISMMFNVVTKLIFNVFASVPLAVDTWSLIDILCAFSIIFTQIMLSQIQPEDIIDLERKMFYNIMMLLAIIMTWARVIGFFLVMDNFS